MMLRRVNLSPMSFKQSCYALSLPVGKIGKCTVLRVGFSTKSDNSELRAGDLLRSTPYFARIFVANQLDNLAFGLDRARLVNKKNTDRLKTGDTVKVERKDGESLTGLCLAIRRRSIDSSFLLRSQTSKHGWEMWIKVFNPNICNIEITSRSPKVMKSKLYHLRKI